MDAFLAILLVAMVPGLVTLLPRSVQEHRRETADDHRGGG